MTTNSVATRRVSDVTVIDVFGRITLGRGSSALRDAVITVLSDGQTKMLINLTGVEYVDSSGVAELVWAVQNAKTRGADLKLTGLSRRVTDLLTLTKVLPLFDVSESEATAIAGF